MYRLEQRRILLASEEQAEEEEERSRKQIKKAIIDIPRLGQINSLLGNNCVYHYN
jgi:hypothetical protein